MNKFQINYLLVSIQNGDKKALDKLYIATKNGVFTFLYSYFNNYMDTEDAMQEVYLKIIRGINSYKPGTNGIAWILQIAKNHALNIIKSNKDVSYIENDVKDEKQDISIILKVMKEVLTEDEYRIVTLHTLWNVKHKDIAKEENVPVGTITSKYKRAIEKVRENLRKPTINKSSVK